MRILFSLVLAGLAVGSSAPQQVPTHTLSKFGVEYSEPFYGLVSLLDLTTADRADRVVALGGAAAAGWFLVRGGRRR